MAIVAFFAGSWGVSVPRVDAAAPPLLNEFCKTGSSAGKCRVPRGVAVNSANGLIYVADQGNARVEEFTAWGEFIRTWGWDVVASGPGDDPGDKFEVCDPAAGDVCKEGQSGPGEGQLSVPQAVALDSAGDVYVVDLSNHRVQKFDVSPTDVQFELMFGGNVNRTKVEGGAGEAQRNRCPVDPSDVCQAGVEGTGQAQFGAWPAEGGSFIAPSPDAETLYVGDQNRIQEFDAEGNYLGEIALPEAGTVRALAVDPTSGDLYFAYASGLAPYPSAECNQPDVHRLDSLTGGEIDELAVDCPGAVATDGAGNVYVFGREVFVTNGDPRNHPPRVIKFDSSGKETDRYLEGAFSSASTGIATSSACGLESPDLLIANANLSNSFVRIYGPPPQDAEACPPPQAAPEIQDQYAVSVGSNGASVQAVINPRFWPDTRYYVEYGTGICSLEECGERQPLPPGTVLTSDVKNSSIPTSEVLLSGLQPGTLYHYRFVAESSGGGPVFGAGATEAEPQGNESTFTTFEPPQGPKATCPNQSFRTSFSAPLPDCRAYELVSPLDKNNGDIANDENSFDESNLEASSPDGARVTYSSIRSFGSAAGAPLVSQYLSSRDPGTGWSTHSISPPRTSVPFYGPGSTLSTIQFKAFSEDLCSGWFIQDTDLALVSGAPPGVPNVYRRGEAGCGNAGYELITPVAPPGFDAATEPTDSAYMPETQGISSDAASTLLRADAVLTADACMATIPEAGVDEGRGIFQLYLHTSGAEGQLNLVSVLPSGEPACVHSSGGTAQSQFGDPREDSVHHALAGDASRVFWSTSASSQRELPPYGGGQNDQAGPLYLRLNPTQPPSATQFGGATGTGDVFAPAKGAGTVLSAKEEVLSVEVKSGEFVVGQEISDSNGGIPAGTTIQKIEEPTKGSGILKFILSAKATKTKAGDELIGVSNILEAKADTGQFAVGQSITGPGIPAGTTIAAVQETSAGVFRLVLSANATSTHIEAPLEAWSSCTEPDKGCTVPISLADDTRFWDADPSGSTAIYTAGGGLFEFNTSEGKSTAIAPSGVKGVMGMSEDASRVYFVSTAVLTGEEENSEGVKAVLGQPNLYLHERGAGFTFVGTLSSLDIRNTAIASVVPSPIATLPNKRVARVSADGMHAAFTAAATLTGYENTDVASGQPDAEVYLYDAETDDLDCVSCNASGARPRGENLNPAGSPAWTAATLPGWEGQLYPTRALLDSGDKLFFESFEGLVLRDTNDRRDVYEWERAAGAKECAEQGAERYVEAAGGCIGLISSGKSSIGSEFLDASDSGIDVFFTTAASLLTQDPGLLDVYDAREGGGFPPPPSPVPPCEGEACQPATPPPPPENHASSSFQGEGNVNENPKRRCGKGRRRVVRRGKAHCVKKHGQRHPHQTRSRRRTSR